MTEQPRPDTVTSHRLAGKVAFITGIARGQGRAHALRMASEGADIIGVDLAGPLPDCVPYDSATPADLAKTVSMVEERGGRILVAEADTRDQEALAAVVSEGVAAFGGLDVVVANAGVAAPATWDEITVKDFREVLDINVTGTWNTVMAAAPAMIEAGRGGSVVLISSAAGIKMQAFMIHYTASKHAVTGMARAFAAELGTHRIRVNSVHPGPVNTPMGNGRMVERIVETGQSNPGLGQMMSAFLPDGISEADDIAATVAWLASDDARHVTAAAIPVDLGTTQY